MVIVYWIHTILLLLFSLSLIYNAWRSVKMARKKQKPIIEKENKDGFISGGYIYDQLDRFAQVLALSISNHTYEFTHYGFIKYLKQLCTDDFYIGYNWKFRIGRRYFIKVYAKNREGVKVASAIFIFVGTEKNYCDLKKKKV